MPNCQGVKRDKMYGLNPKVSISDTLSHAKPNQEILFFCPGALVFPPRRNKFGPSKSSSSSRPLGLSSHNESICICVRSVTF